MRDWSKCDCDVSVYRQTNTLVFGRSRLRAPHTRARAGFARARPGVRGMKFYDVMLSKALAYGKRWEALHDGNTVNTGPSFSSARTNCLKKFFAQN